MAPLVNIEAAEASVPADKKRELAAIGEANFGQVNGSLKAALGAGAVAAKNYVFEVDAFICGEPGPLRSLDDGRVGGVVATCCAAGQLAVLIELERTHKAALVSYFAWRGTDDAGAVAPVLLAAAHGRVEVVVSLG